MVSSEPPTAFIEGLGFSLVMALLVTCWKQQGHGVKQTNHKSCSCVVASPACKHPGGRLPVVLGGGDLHVPRCSVFSDLCSSLFSVLFSL